MEGLEKSKLQLSTAKHHDMLLSLREWEKAKGILLMLTDDLATLPSHLVESELFHHKKGNLRMLQNEA